MQFRIADTFTDSLAKLTNQEQKAVKTTVFDLQIDPANPGIQLHKLDRAKDQNFWSARVNRDIRLIVHRTSGNFLICYVAHHDDAYAWAERRKIETHPKTGAAQLVEIRERVEEIPVYEPVVAAPTPEPVAPKPLLFDGVDDERLLAFGVPPEWLEDVKAANEDTIFELTDHLPQEAAEALLDLAVGVEPVIQPPVPQAADPFAHPDAQRRFRVFENTEELAQALDYPWEKWTVFLHPAQRTLVEKTFNGPARISGSAGTGKTIVALHRAVFLARQNKDARILLTTFSETLARALRTKLLRLAGNEPRVVERIEVSPLLAVAQRLYRARWGEPQIASPEMVQDIIREEAGRREFSRNYSATFLQNEWAEVIDAWQIKSEEDYQDVVRLGRKTRLRGQQRSELWALYQAARDALQAKGLVTEAALIDRITEELFQGNSAPFDFAVVDEAQDLSVPALRFLAALGQHDPQALFFAGDLGQRIFQTPFSWKSLGVDVRGRSHTLRINYRTSHQIRSQADRLLPHVVSDVDGISENRKGTVSVFNGPPPNIRIIEDQESEGLLVSQWIKERLDEGYHPEEIGIIVRSADEIERAVAAAQAANLKHQVLNGHPISDASAAAIGTMHLAKGLEFRAVVVMACDDEILPLQSRVESVSDESDLQEVYDTERHLLYVACTRARDQLLVTGVAPGSEFLDDFGFISEAAH